jgi:hypothetical protein
MPQQEMKRPTNQGDVALFDAQGQYVTTVAREAGVPPDIIVWGSRHFVRRHGVYGEATVFATMEGQR